MQLPENLFCFLLSLSLHMLAYFILLIYKMKFKYVKICILDFFITMFLKIHTVRIEEQKEILERQLIPRFAASDA